MANEEGRDDEGDEAGDGALVSIAVSHRDRGVVRAGNVFVKVETESGRAAREREMLAAARDWAGIPTPDLLWSSAGPPDVLVLSTVPGRPIRVDDPPDRWEQLGALLRSLHDAPLPDWPVADPAYPSIVPWAEAEIDWLVDQGLGSPGIRAAGPLLAGVLSNHTHRGSVIHGDLQTDHVFVDGDAITGIIDWADCIIGDPLADVAVVTSRAPLQLAALQAGYGAIDADVVQALWALRFLGEIRWLLERDLDPRPPIAALDDLFAIG